jgi:hypothetical protein
MFRMVRRFTFDINDNEENDNRNNNRLNREEGGGTNSQQKLVHYFSLSVVVLSSILIFLTYFSLGALRTLVIRSSNSNNLDFEYTSADEASKQYLSPMKSMVTMLCSFGLIVASILNGFGCSSLPHSNLVGIFLRPTPLALITQLENDCYYAKTRLEEKQCLLADTIQSSIDRRTSSSSSFSPSQSTLNAEKQLQNEVMFLTYLVADLTDDIHEMKQSHQLALQARTSIGRIRVVFGVIFSIVLVVRVLLASKSFSLLFQDNQKAMQSPRDPVTSAILWLTGKNIVSEDQYDDLAQGTSLVLAGVLSTSQVSAFLRVVSALGRKMNRILGSTCGMTTTRGKADHLSAIKCAANIVASFVMGSYFLSCVVVVKMNLPVEYRASFSSAVGFNFDFNTTALNLVFFTAAVASALILGLLFGIQRSHSARNQLDSQLINTPLGTVSAQIA